jgi:hypothetical protein
MRLENLVHRLCNLEPCLRPSCTTGLLKTHCSPIQHEAVLEASVSTSVSAWRLEAVPFHRAPAQWVQTGVSYCRLWQGT